MGAIEHDGRHLGAAKDHNFYLGEHVDDGGDIPHICHFFYTVKIFGE